MKKFDGSKSPFLTPEELSFSRKQDKKYEEEEPVSRMMNAPNPIPRGYITDWKRTAARAENDDVEGYLYPAIRREGKPIGKRTIESYHNDESFISWIKQKLSDSDYNKVVNVLDVGGGAGLYAEQIRKEFGDKVDVYTTGLRKQAAVKLRSALTDNTSEYFKMPKDISIDAKPHRQDLKWRSILQLSDYEEFDLIVDTAGEFAYAARDRESINRYVAAVVHKLLPGGKASIGFINEAQMGIIGGILTEIERNKEYGDNISFDLKKNGFKSKEQEYVLKIEKHVNSTK